jgi:drug/metabolite transporter (DMT)-like permease
MTATLLSRSSGRTTGRTAWTGVAAAFGTVTIWAMWIVGTRQAVTTSLEPATVGLLRFGVPALALAPIWWRTGLLPRGVTPWQMLALLGSGAPFFVTVANGMRFAPAAEIGPLLPGTMPLFVALIGWALLGEQPGRRRIAGLLLVLMGIVAVAGPGILKTVNGAWRGHLLLVGGALMWAIYTQAFKASRLTALEAAAAIAIWSLLLLLPFGAPGLVAAIKAGEGNAIVTQAVLQGLLSGLIAIILYGVAVDRLGASRAATIVALGPPLAALMAAPMLGEQPTLFALIGIAATTLGVALASWRPAT